MRTMNVADAYRAAIRSVANWETLAHLAEKITYDRRLEPRERDTLYSAVDVQERGIRPKVSLYFAT